MDPLEVFLQALENVKPKLEVKSRRVGGGHLSGSDRSQPGPSGRFGDALDYQFCQRPQGSPDDGFIGRRAHGRL